MKIGYARCSTDKQDLTAQTQALLDLGVKADRADLIRHRTREGMAIARSKGKLRGKQPKLSDRQQQELARMHNTGEYSISELAELFAVSRPTVYRTIARHKALSS